MSRLLINEHPLQVLPTLATKVGLNEAIFVQQLHYWLDINRKAKRNIIHGTVWSYNTYAQWRQQFPFWSDKTLRRTVKSCEDQGLIRSAQLSPDKRDRTLYYTIRYERLTELELEIQNERAGEDPDPDPDPNPPSGGRGDEGSVASGQNDHMGGNAMGMASGQNDHMHSSAGNPPSGQSDHMGPGQNDQVQVGQNDHMHVGQSDQMYIEQRLPTETSSETSSSSARDDESDPHAELLTAADLEDIEKGRFSKRVNSAIAARTKEELLKEVPARKAWDRLPEREKAIAFKSAQARKQLEQTSKSFATVLKEELDKACNIKTTAEVSTAGFVAQHHSDPYAVVRDRDRRQVADAATRAYEAAWDAAIAEGLNEAQAHLRADRASNAARREALARVADERAREQEQQEINRKNELLRQATLLGLAN